MWPFSSRKSRQERIEECDHEWEEYVDEVTHPQNIYYEEGTPFVHKLTTRSRSCKHCPESEMLEQSEKKICFEVSHIEEL